MVEIAAQEPADGPAIEDLLDAAFGRDRLSRPSYRLRERVAPISGLGFVARDENRLVATLRFWPVVIGDAAPALLLGPLAVDAAYRHRAIASSLIARGLEDATNNGHRMVAAVGDLGLFGRFGFIAAAPLGLVMPGLADAGRLLVMALAPGALDSFTGAAARGTRFPVSCTTVGYR